VLSAEEGSYRKSSLKEETVHALICYQNWLKLSFSYFKDLQLMEDAELSKDIITCEIFILFLNNNHIINFNVSEKLYN